MDCGPEGYMEKLVVGAEGGPEKLTPLLRFYSAIFKSLRFHVPFHFSPGPPS
jgi:hypothetical protein